MEKLSENEDLLLCYLSGQMSERQWQAHCADRGFRAWLKARRVAPGMNAPVHHPLRQDV